MTTRCVLKIRGTRRAALQAAENPWDSVESGPPVFRKTGNGAQCRLPLMMTNREPSPGSIATAHSYTSMRVRLGKFQVAEDPVLLVGVFFQRFQRQIKRQGESCHALWGHHGGQLPGVQPTTSSRFYIANCFLRREHWYLDQFEVATLGEVGHL